VTGERDGSTARPCDPVAILPAAGRATRLGLESGSKELVPLGPADDEITTLGRLLGCVRTSGITRAVVVTRSEKEDVVATAQHLVEGLEVELCLIAASRSVPETLAHGLQRIGDAPVALAFPDILYEPTDFFRPLVDRHRETTADVVLGLFPTARGDRSDMVETDETGSVRRIWIKAGRDDLAYAWGAAVWGPRFSRLVVDAAEAPPGDRELQIGQVVQRAIDLDLDVDSIAFPDGLFLDIGTPVDLERARALLLA